MSDASRIVVRPHPAISPEDARDARARALRYAFERYREKQKAAKTGGEKGPEEPRAPSERDKDLRQ
jgi:hypothetical protein